MKIHRTITQAKVVDAVERTYSSLDLPGFCIECGHGHDPCDQDAEGDECDRCGKPAVWGAEALLMEVA